MTRKSVCVFCQPSQLSWVALRLYIRYIMFNFVCVPGVWVPLVKDSTCVQQHPSTQDPLCCHCAHEVTSGNTTPSLPPLVHPFPSPLSLPPFDPPSHGPEDLWQYQISGCTRRALLSASTPWTEGPRFLSPPQAGFTAGHAISQLRDPAPPLLEPRWPVAQCLC